MMISKGIGCKDDQRSDIEKRVDYIQEQRKDNERQMKKEEMYT